MELEEKQVNKGVEKLIGMIGKLEAPEFIGLCKLLGVEIYEEVAPIKETNLGIEVIEDTSDVQVSAAGQPSKSVGSTSESHRETAEENQERNSDIVMRPAELLIPEVMEKIALLNRVQRRNLEKILKPAVKGR